MATPSTFCLRRPLSVLAPGALEPAVSDREWIRITEDDYWNDKARWSPDGKTIYFISNRTGFLNVGGIRFDPTQGKPLGQPFRVTAFESPGRMVFTGIVPLEISLSGDRLVAPIMEVSGNIWRLDNVE